MKLTNRITLAILAFFCIVTLSTSCQQTSNKVSLSGSKWRVETLISDGNLALAPDTHQLTLEFLSDSTFGATTVCNSISGDFKQLSDSTLSLSTIAITSAFCPDDTLESIFLEHLNLASSFSMTSDTLVLKSDDLSGEIKLSPIK